MSNEAAGLIPVVLANRALTELTLSIEFEFSRRSPCIPPEKDSLGVVDADWVADMLKNRMSRSE